jgi:ABC-type glycerol-3-phosphate transport system substrate-binding protein
VRLAVKQGAFGSPDPFALDLSNAAKELLKDRGFILDLVTISTNGTTRSTAAQIAETYAAKIASGVDADLIVADRTTLRPLATRSLLEDLGPLLGKQTWFNREEYLSNILQAGQIRGVQVGLPLDAAVDVVGYSKSRFQKQGLADLPIQWTWDELIATAKALTTGERWGIQVSAWSPNIFSIAWQYGADIVSSSGKLVVTEPGTIQALTLLNRLLNVERVGPPLDRTKPLEQDDDPFSNAWDHTSGEAPEVTRLSQGTIAMLAGLSSRAGDQAWWRRHSLQGYPEEVTTLPTSGRAVVFGTPFTIVGIPKKSANLDQSIAALRDLVDLADRSEILPARKTNTTPRQRLATLSDGDSNVLTTTFPKARFLPGDVASDVYQLVAANLVLPVLTGQKKPEEAAADAQRLIDVAMSS